MQTLTRFRVCRDTSSQAAPSPSPRRSIGRRAVRLAVIGLVLLAAMEIGAQVMGFGRRIEYDSSLSVLWQPRPGQRACNNITNAPVTIDHRGLRATPLSGGDSEERINVLALGDSVTFGYALADHETYVSRLQAWLERQEPGRWRLMNGGVNGYNLYLVKQRLAELLDRGVKPDLVLIGYCFNEYARWPGEHFSEQEKSAITTGVRRKNLLRTSALFNLCSEVLSPGLMHRLRNMLMPRPVASPKAEEPASSWLPQYRRRVEALCEEVAQRGIPYMVIVWPDRSGVRGAYRASLDRECAKRNVPCLDLDRLLQGRDRSGMFFDFEHPRADTVSLYVEEGIAPFFRDQAPALIKPSGRPR